MSQAHLCHHCLYQFKLLNSPNESGSSTRYLLNDLKGSSKEDRTIQKDPLHLIVCAEVNTDVQGFSFGSVNNETKMSLLSKLVTIKFLNKRF